MTATLYSVLVGGALGLFALCGLIVYLLFIIVVLTNHSLRSNAYYAIAVSVGFADMLFLIITIIYGAPCMMLQEILGLILHFHL
jgi:hypothetical protein